MPAKQLPHSNGRAAPPTAYPWDTLDRIIVVTYAIFCTIAILVDYINAFAPVGLLTRSKAAEWQWPPAFIWPLYFWWCEHADPILQYNPLWIKYLSLLSPVIFAPFYIINIYAILTRQNWIRIPSVIYASILFVDLSAFYVEAIWGELPSPNMWIFSAGYGYYQMFPLLLLYRFWADDPFCKQQQRQQKKRIE